MKIAIASIQRNRNPYIVEWIAFHLAVGFNQFYIYCHKTDDGMKETLLQLSKEFPIQVFALEMNDLPQIAAYNHAWSNFGNAVDWMAFIDGDEFLFPTADDNMQLALTRYQDTPLSALGVFWKCYGSNGHIEDPPGLLLENYPRHSDNSFYANRHIKSIARGGEIIVTNRSHLFETEHGTVDEHLRPITHGLMADYEPTYDVFRINHYVTQSLNFFLQKKQNMGAADLPAGVRRPDEWFTRHDRNEAEDGVSGRFLERTKEQIRRLENCLQRQSPPAKQIEALVRDYRIVDTASSANDGDAGRRGQKEILLHIPLPPGKAVSLLDIDLHLGDFGQALRNNTATTEWQQDGIADRLAVGDSTYFAQRYPHYRNIWRGTVSDLPGEQLATYDIVCLFDHIDHLTASEARQLLKHLLSSLNERCRLVVSARLCFSSPSSASAKGETQRIAIPPRALFALQPQMFHIDHEGLIGTFVLARPSLPQIDNFHPTIDPSFGRAQSLAELRQLGRQADGVLYFVSPSGE